MGNLEYFTLGRRNLDCKNHWEQLASDYYRITKPTVLCFGGNGAIGSLDANAMCKIAQGLVGLKYPSIVSEYATSYDVDFVGIGYGRNKEKGNEVGGLTDKERENFVRNIFLPLCITENGSIAPSEQIIKNFNQITFFAHCYGASEISTLIGRTYREMLKIGVEDDTANKAIDQMFAVSYAPYKKCACPNLQVIPMRDSALVTGARDSTISTQFIEARQQSKDYTSSGTVAYKEDEYTASVLVSGMLKNRLSEHFVNFVSRDEDWQYIRSGRAEYGDEVSKAMGYALATSVANSINNQNSETFTPKPTVDEVLQDVQDILGETQNSNFEDIIQQIKVGDLGEQTTEVQPDAENLETQLSVDGNNEATVLDIKTGISIDLGNEQ